MTLFEEVKEIPVPFVPIKEICYLKRGKAISKEDIKKHPGCYPVYSGQSRNNGIFGYLDSYMYDGEYVTYVAVGYTGFAFYRNEKFNITGASGILEVKDKKQLLPKFLCYIANIIFPKYGNIVHKGYTNLTSNIVQDIPIPLPSMEIQEKIVHFLDLLTKLNENLNKELKLRQRQYQYYLQYFFKTYCQDVPFVPIKEICYLKRGKAISKEDIKKHPGCYPVYSSQTSNNGIFGYLDSYMYDGEYVTWTTNGVYAGTTFYHNEKFNITNISGILEVKDKKQLLPKFLYYCSKLSFFKYVNRVMSNAQLMSHTVQDIPIPLPSMEIQEKIVHFLSSLEELSSSLTGKLPKEIELNKKRYLYYQNKLLNFQEK